MSAWRERTKAAFERELALGRARFDAGDLDGAFAHFERAHILGQRRTVAHVRAHWWMLRVGRARRDAREVRGQWLRIVAAATKLRIRVPLGNTGGADVDPLKPMAVPEDLRELL
jgi:hypothetical protein